MSLFSVDWSKCCEMGMIGGMRRRSFLSRVTMICFYFAEERASLSSSWYHRPLATRNYLLPSRGDLKPLDFLVPVEGQLLVEETATLRGDFEIARRSFASLRLTMSKR